MGRQRGPKVQEYVMVEQVLDKDGNVVSEKETTKTKRIDKVTEPDYIKLYTEKWNGKGGNPIPIGYRPLFIELASRMSYCEADDFEHSQLVLTSGIYQEAIMKALGLGSRDSLQKGLKALCDCNAIRRVQRGMYQVNPEFDRKGKWKYNVRVSRSSLDEFVDYYSWEKKKAERKKIKQMMSQMDMPGKEGPDLDGEGEPKADTPSE